MIWIGARCELSQWNKEHLFADYYDLTFKLNQPHFYFIVSFTLLQVAVGETSAVDVLFPGHM